MKRLGVVAALVLAWTGLTIGPSAATTYYEYWGYWHKPPGATKWQYSNTGASGYYLKSGDQVEGWRFAVGTASSSDPQPANLSYSTYCGSQPQDPNKPYRVLLVVDYGTMSDAPKGPVYSCYQYAASDNASGYTVVSHHPLRENGGLICAIDNYPKTGCGEVVSSPAPKATPKPTATATAQPTPTATRSPAVVAPTLSPKLSPTKSATTRHTGLAPSPTQTRVATQQPQAFDPRPSRSSSASPPIGVIVGACVAAAFAFGAFRLQRRRR